MKHTGGDIRFTMTGLGSVFVYDRVKQRAHEIPELIAAMLSRTSAMATLDEHARSLCQRLGMPASQQGALRAHLGELAEAGLLVSEQDLRTWALDHAEPESAPGLIDTAAILGGTTPARTRAALRALAHALTHHGRDCQIVLMDDAGHPRDRDRGVAAELAAELAAGSGPAVAYAGREERQRFADALAAAGIDRRAVDIALGVGAHDHPVAPGVARNALLLHTAGQTCFAAGGDTVARLAGPAGFPDVLGLSNRDPASLWVYPDHDAALAGAAFLDPDQIDLLACHELLLGKDLGTCMAVFDSTGDATGHDGSGPGGPALAIDGMRPPFYRRLCHGGRVAVTVLGLIGDHDQDSNHAYLLQEAGALAHLLRGPAPYPVLRDARSIHRLVPHLTLSSNPAFSATAAAYDNRELLPPFLPAGRGDDMVFGLALRACLPRDVIGHLPWAICHEPTARAPFTADDLVQGPLALTLARAAALAMGTLDLLPAAGEPADRMRHLGAHLEQVGQLSLADFEHLLHAAHLRRLGSHISACEQRLGENGAASDEWAEDMEQTIEALRAACAEPRLPAAADLAPRLGEERAREALRAHIRDYGLLLQVWPDMLQAARDLRHGGHPLARGTGARG